MRRLAAVAARHWRATLLIWALLVAVSVAAAPDFTEVATYDDNAFLPTGADSVRGAELMRQGWPDDNFTSSAVIALLRDDGPLTQADRAVAGRLVEWLPSDAAPTGLGRTVTHLDEPDLEDSLTSKDGHAMLLVAGMEVPPFSPMGHEVVTELRRHIAETDRPEGLDVMVTGAAGIALDENAAIEASVKRTELLTVLLVVVLVLWVLRSPVAALVPLVTVAGAYAVALAVVGTLARLGMDVSYLFQMFAIVIVFGAGTDYALLILARYQEELADSPDAAEAEGRARRLAGTMVVLAGVLASTAASTMVGFSAQVVAQFGLFRTMGPALAIAVLITLLAGLTLTPAIMRLCGRWLFWPGGLVTGKGMRAGHGPGGGDPVWEIVPADEGPADGARGDAR
ncbi:MAG TPA: MMPL family transporter [Egibacteraceae bacterium]|nr:MMPL family transporter [Egibacteraceae bacterium]